MKKIKVIYKSNEFILIKKFFNNHSLEEKGVEEQQKKLKINLLNFDSKFFFGLVHFSSRNINFQISNIKFFSNILYLRLSKQYKKKYIEFDLDFKFFLSNFESFINLENQNQVKYLQITASFLCNYDPIILAWYVL